MKPDYERSAIMATETLISFNAEEKESKINQIVGSLPITPLPIIQSMKHVLAMPFAELANNAGIERNNLVPMFGNNQDAVTFFVHTDRIKYVVAYNQYLPFDALRRALARELGHIVLGHDGTKPIDVRMSEAMCFARHLIFPRSVIHAIQQAGFPITIEILGSITGCFERCLEGLRKTPGVHVPADLNRKVKAIYEDSIRNFIDFQATIHAGDKSAIADFGSFMDNYEE